MNDYKNGGLKMIDPKSFCRYLKIIWIKRLVSSNGLWQNLIKTILTDCGSDTIFSFQKPSCKTLQNVFPMYFGKMLLIIMLYSNKIKSKVKHIS